MRQRRLDVETAFNAVLLGLGGVIAYVAWGYGFGSLALPGPGLYPFFLGATIAACAAALIAARARAGEAAPRLDKHGARILLVTAATLCLWILAMPVLGYVAVTFIATYALSKALALEGWRKPLALSGATALFVYLLFGFWLFIDLPRGILFE
ncbi:MAG: tripartite tricarboxylate transporter TctB family protein [Burkholderiales bacterium]|nr:tripartite tricarboxylate transporter TctB family protein [Burkholderiales bacterium]